MCLVLNKKGVKMMTLNNDATKENLENYLLYHMDEADGRRSKNNPSLTKEQVWNLHMAAVVKGDITRVKELMIKQLIKEFGEYYE
jgi:hypothetical protein